LLLAARQPTRRPIRQRGETDRLQQPGNGGARAAAFKAKATLRAAVRRSITGFWNTMAWRWRASSAPQA